MSDQTSQGLLSPLLRKKRIQMVKPYLKGNVLDVGCGSGSLAAFVEKDNYLGFDIDKKSILVASTKFPQHNFTTIKPLPEKRFNTIVCMAVLEHTKNPVAFLQQWSSYLLPSQHSRFVLTTPHPQIEHIHAIGSKIRLFSWDGNAEHEVLIDFKRMSKIAKQANMSILTFKKFLFGMNQLFVLSKD